MKRLTLILMMLSFAVPTWALAELEIHMEQKEENGQSLTVFSAEETQTEENTPAPDATPNPALLMANGLIESCFEQTKGGAADPARGRGTGAERRGLYGGERRFADSALERHADRRHSGKRGARAGARPDDGRRNPPETDV